MVLTVNSFAGLYDAWADAMVENKDELIRLDAIAGDGDLGLAMMDGFHAIQNYAKSADTDDLGMLFYNSGKTMNEHASSSLGTLISSGFMSAGKAFRGKKEMTGCELAAFLEAFENGIIARGKSKVGEKTFLDGFDPAVQVMKANPDEASVGTSLAKAAIAAQNGSASTVGMLAVWGRAARRGEDSRQILDPGSVVASVMISTLADCFASDK